MRNSFWINADFNNKNREDNGFLKVDYTASQRSSFYATYFVGDSLQTEETHIQLGVKVRW